MEHFGYPDLECRGSGAPGTVEAVVRGAVAHLLNGGGDALRPGDRVVAEHEGQHRCSLTVELGPLVADHPFGAYGTLALHID
jgi:hypothetical protein